VERKIGKEREEGRPLLSVPRALGRVHGRKNGVGKKRKQRKGRRKEMNSESEKKTFKKKKKKKKKNKKGEEEEKGGGEAGVWPKAAILTEKKIKKEKKGSVARQGTKRRTEEGSVPGIFIPH